MHGLAPVEIELWLGATAATTGVAGTFLGGWLTDRLSHRDLSGYAWLPGWGSILVVPFVLRFNLWDEGREALALAALPAIPGGLYLAARSGSLQAGPPRAEPVTESSP